MREIERREFVRVLLAGAAAALAPGCGSKTVKITRERSAQGCDAALELFTRDVDQVRKGMPEGAKILEKRMPADPRGNPLELQTSIKAARENVKDLMYAKSTFFSYAALDGLVLRSEIDPDRLVGQNIIKVYPTLAKAVEPGAGLVEAWGEMDALRGVKQGNDTAWVVAHGVNGADGKAQGFFLSGWSLRLYLGFVQEEVRRRIDEKTKDSRDKSELYLFVVKGKLAYGHPEAPDVHAQSIEKHDPVAKNGDSYTEVEMEGRTWSISSKKAPMLGDDAAVATISTIY